MGAQDWGSRPPKVQALTPAATVSLDPRIAPIFKISPGENETINATDGGYPGEQLSIYFDTIDTNSRTITFGTNFRSTGTLATGATAARRFVVKFESDGIVWTEISRTAAQA
jgi:hypothetical protein